MFTGACIHSGQAMETILCLSTNKKETMKQQISNDNVIYIYIFFFNLKKEGSPSIYNNMGEIEGTMLIEMTDTEE